MHNSPRKNLEFQITFTETNLRYLLGATPLDEDKIAKNRAALAECQGNLKKMVDGGKP